VKKLILENAIVNEKLTQISSENRELNENIEELDKQHCLAVENILGMKQSLQDQLTQLQQQHDRVIKQSEDQAKKKVERITSLEVQNTNLERLLAESKASIEKIEKSHTTSLQENVESQKKIESLTAELKAQAEKSSNDGVSHDKDMSKKLASLEAEKRKIEQDFIALQEEDLIRQRELSQLKTEFELKMAELSEVTTEKRKWEQDFHALQDDDLSLQAIHRAMEEKVVILESQTVPKARFEELEKNYGSLERKLRKSKTPDSAREREIETLHSEKLKVEQDLIALQDDDLTLQTEYRNLQEAYNELEKKIRACDADNTEVLQLRKQLEDSANELSVLNLENIKLKEHSEIDRNQLEEQVFSLEEKYAEMVQKSEELDRKLKVAESNRAKDDDVDQLRLTNSNISTMNQQMSETYKILSDKLLVAELELSEIKNHFEQKVSKIQNLEQEKTNLTQIIENLKSHEETPAVATAVVTSDSLTENEVLDLLKKYLDYEYEPDDDKPERKHLEDFLRSHRDLQSKHYALERKLIEFSKDITSIKDQNAKLLHEKETMKADLLNYEIECTELMKNNGLLLSQLEAVQSNKLETIHENNEDNIVVLERQLEQCNNLNENLEEQYHQLKEQFSSMMSQKETTPNADVSLESNWDEMVQLLKQQIEHLEVDKGNLLFEINDLKADRSVLETEMLDYKSRAESTEEQHAVVTEDLAHVVAKLHALEKQHSEANSRYEETIDAQAKIIADKEKALKFIQADVKQFQRDATEADSMCKTNESLVASLQIAEQKCVRLAEEVRVLEVKVEELQTQHEQVNQELLTEKNGLIALVTTKHNENVQYHNEIQRLGQLLMAEIEKNKTMLHAAPEPCQTCRQLQEELTAAKESASSHISGEVEKMTDQIHFLKEKCDILTKNLMMEQSNQKLLNQECVELKEQKQALVKETDRLRQHLLEIEESHTMETVELQKTIDDLRQKLAHIEVDAKQSSTAYTSARWVALRHK
jgi:thyroid receptor-interacting protein 11